MSQRLDQLKRRSPRLVVGLNIGTSLDGVDAGLLEVQGQGLETAFRLLRFETLELPDPIRRVLMNPEAMNPRTLARLDMDVGLTLAAAANEVLLREWLPGRHIDIIGSHGVTVWHEPPRNDHELGASLQVGNPAVIAEKTGAVVVSNFRSADIAASGQGAPLMPWLDHLLFHQEPGTILINLGGIANLTYISGDLESLLAFDTGPANLPLNEVVRVFSKGHIHYDGGGRLAAQGRIDPDLMSWLGRHPFLQRVPPKSTGREEFGEAWTQDLLSRFQHKKLLDILATLTAFVSRSIRCAVADFVEPRLLRRVLVSGGGVHNHSLMHNLQRDFGDVPVENLEDVGINPDAKEAILFALLANERIFDLPAGIPAATGALWPATLGQITA